MMQKKSLRLAYFYLPYVYATLIRGMQKFKIADKIALENSLFINKYYNKILSTIFKNWFTLSTNSYKNNSRWSNLGFDRSP